MSSPCHIEMFAEIPVEGVKKEKEVPRTVSLRKQAKSKIRRFLVVGGDSN